MPNITSRDDVLAPEKTMTFTYKGKNALKSINEAKDTIFKVFGVPGKNQNDIEIKYDTSDPSSVSFYGLFRGGDDWTDSYSELILYIKVQGSQNNNTKEGQFTVWVTPYMVTQISYSNSFTKLLWIAWSYMFYNKKRRQYIERARQMSEEAKRKLASKFGVNLKSR